MAAIARFVAWLRGRWGAVLVVFVAWTVLTAASAGRAADDDTWVGLPSLDWLSYLVAVMMAIGLVITILAIVLGRGERGPLVRRRRPLWPMVLLLLIALALGQRAGNEFGDTEGQELNPQVEEPVEAADGPRPTGGLGPGELTVLLLMLAAASAVVGFSRWRAGGEATVDIGPDETLETHLAPAIERAGRHLLNETDPRSAVLLAYADLEKALARAGQAAAAHETPNEHLQRVLRHLSINSEPLLRLAGLYQRARFSEHTISSGEQHEAGAALQSVRSQLATAQ